MKAKIVEGCIGCGLCVGVCSDVFAMQETGTATVMRDPTPDEEPLVQEAAEGCPVSVILVESEET